MRAAELRAALGRLGLSQAEAARLLGVRLRTVQRWIAGRPEVAEPAAQALRAWCRLAERGLVWRPDGEAIVVEDLALAAAARRRTLGFEEILARVAARGGPKRRWRVNIARRRAATQGIVVSFDQLADGSFLPASYCRTDGTADLRRDWPVVEEAIAVFADFLARASAGWIKPGLAAIEAQQRSGKSYTPALAP